MIEQLRSYIDYLFEPAPKNNKTFDLKEEVLANSIERFEDLLSQGISEQDAYQNVIGSIGNISELLADLDDAPEFTAFDDQSSFPVHEFASPIDQQKANEKIEALMGAASGLLWVFTTFIYLAVSFLTKRWDITWMMFLLAVCVQMVITFVFKLLEK